MYGKYECVALFSGGLDSILACKIIQDQGLNVLGLHFVSPFFGQPQKKGYWEQLFGLDVQTIDISREIIDLLLNNPRYGFGKYFNPCIDCKILMLQKAKNYLQSIGADSIITGEVQGQRPMSQKKDSLKAIHKRAGVEDLVIRPLSSTASPLTSLEKSGKVNRSKFFNISGRGRKDQLQLAEEYNLPEIPTPAGGCLLTDPESVKRYARLLRYIQPPKLTDLYLCNLGRQFWSGPNWLIIGRDKNDNQNLLQLVQKKDILFKLADYPGPIALGRQLAETWDQEAINQAAEFIINFSPKAKKAETPIRVKIGYQGGVSQVWVNRAPKGQHTWQEPSWEDFRALKKKLSLSKKITAINC